MSLLQKSDLQTFIRTYRLDEITDDNDAVIDAAIADAEAMVIDNLHATFDTSIIWNTTGNDRPKNVLVWIKYIALYYIYERVADDLVPERVIKNYEETIKTLRKIANGDLEVNLPRIIIAETGKPRTKFRYGGNNPRTY